MYDVNEIKERLDDLLLELSKNKKSKYLKEEVSNVILDGIGLLVRESKGKDNLTSEQENLFVELVDANLMLPQSNRIEWGFGFDDDWTFFSKLSKPIFDYFPKKTLENKNIMKTFSYQEGMSLSPKDVDLYKVMNPFISDDDLRPAMMGINFDEYGATATNAHILMHLGGKSTEEGVFLPLIKSEVANSYNNGINQRKVDAKYPNYSALIQSDYELITTIDTQLLYNAINLFLKSSFLNKQTHQLFIKVDGLQDYLDRDFNVGFNAELLKETLSSWLMLGIKSLSVYNEYKNVNRQFLFVPNGITLYQKYAVQKQLLEGVFSIIMPVLMAYEGQDKAFIDIKSANTLNLRYLNSKPFVMESNQKNTAPVKPTSNTQNLIDDLTELMEFSDSDEKGKLKELINDLKELQSFE